MRGWALNKKIGWRGGLFEGYAPILVAGCVGTNTGGTCINPKRMPALRGFVNFDIIGSEEGGWLYGDYKWGKDMILSVNVAGNYQSQSVRNGFGNLTDARLLSAGAYLNFPMTEQNELLRWSQRHNLVPAGQHVEAEAVRECVAHRKALGHCEADDLAAVLARVIAGR